MMAMPGEASTEGRVAYGILELEKILLAKTLLSHKTTLTLSNKIS